MNALKSKAKPVKKQTTARVSAVNASLKTTVLGLRPAKALSGDDAREALISAGILTRTGKLASAYK